MIYDMIHFTGAMIHILDPKYRHILDLKVHPIGPTIHILDLKVHPIDALRGVRSVNGGGGLYRPSAVIDNQSPPLFQMYLSVQLSFQKQRVPESASCKRRIRLFAVG